MIQQFMKRITYTLLLKGNLTQYPSLSTCEGPYTALFNQSKYYFSYSNNENPQQDQYKYKYKPYQLSYKQLEKLKAIRAKLYSYVKTYITFETSIKSPDEHKKYYMYLKEAGFNCQPKMGTKVVFYRDKFKKPFYIDDDYSLTDVLKKPLHSDLPYNLTDVKILFQATIYYYPYYPNYFNYPSKKTYKKDYSFDIKLDKNKPVLPQLWKAYLDYKKKFYEYLYKPKQKEKNEKSKEKEVNGVNGVDIIKKFHYISVFFKNYKGLQYWKNAIDPATRLNKINYQTAWIKLDLLVSTDSVYCYKLSLVDNFDDYLKKSAKNIPLNNYQGIYFRSWYPYLRYSFMYMLDYEGVTFDVLRNVLMYGYAYENTFYMKWLENVKSICEIS